MAPCKTRSKAPKPQNMTNKERFDFLEQKIESMATAMERLTTSITQGDVQDAPRSPGQQDRRDEPLHESRDLTSTPKNHKSAKRSLMISHASVQDQDSDLDEPLAAVLPQTNSKQIRHQAEQFVRDANA